MAIVTVGIDLAKNVFAVHGVDEAGKPALVRPEVPRAKLLELIASLPPCLIGMEACSGAHHWSREFSKFGHTVRMMAPKFVVPYRMSGKRGKNDAADAAAICEAVTQIDLCRKLLGGSAPVVAGDVPDQTLDYRDRYQRLTGLSLRDCPHCSKGQMVLIESSPLVFCLVVHRPKPHEYLPDIEH